MVYLLDINVLIALAWPSHIHHAAARKWFAQKGAKGWATCPMTQCGFVRISANPKIIADAVSPHEAHTMLSAMTSHKGHTFWPDSIDLTHEQFNSLVIAGHRQVTDAYLLLLAALKKGLLASFDRSIVHLLSSKTGESAPVELLHTPDTVM
ncbi:MAG: VapC toxin family PIN domain ribonuclease [Chitinispirillaceae bacterium]|nr:VapC toxin family PIN domain ribonuclease [Chitinispirillaceae bacterium]